MVPELLVQIDPSGGRIYASVQMSDIAVLEPDVGPIELTLDLPFPL